MAQPVRNLPAMLETWVQPLVWEDPLKKGKATHSSILAWRIPRTVWSMYSPCKESDMTEPLSLSLTFITHLINGTNWPQALSPPEFPIQWIMLLETKKRKKERKKFKYIVFEFLDHIP